MNSDKLKAVLAALLMLCVFGLAGYSVHRGMPLEAALAVALAALTNLGALKALMPSANAPTDVPPQD